MWTKRFRLWLWVVILFLPSCGQEPAAVQTERILRADEEPGQWMTHGRTYSEQRFSPLAAIDTGNVGRLGLAWSYELRTDRAASATPLVVDGVMYVTSSWSLVYALDARTGAELWVYDPEVDRALGARLCCDAVNRGVAVYEGKVFVGVIDGRLVALDARDGSVVWETMTVDSEQPYSITGAPRAARELVFIGNGGAEYGVRGYASAYDVKTGKLAWRFYTVPGDPTRGADGAASDPIMARAAETWRGEWWKLGGGGTVWDTIVYDPDFDQVLIGVGNGSPWNHQLRSPGGGDNWFLASIVALDARSGAYRWHYQTTPGESWDFTATQPIVLADLVIEGVSRKVAMQAPKNGFFYVIDRETGALISAEPFIPMFPAAETPPGLPVSWAYAVDRASGRPLENPEARYHSGVAVVRPDPFGAHNWHPMAYSPETGLVYIPAQDLSFAWSHDPAFVTLPGFWNPGIKMMPLPADPAIRAAIRKSAVGHLIAWDPVRQREAWRVQHRGPWNGGTLATAGGLVFQGTVDGRFLAFDAAGGRQLWEYDNQAATLAGPISYEVDGREHVAVVSGYGGAFFLVAGFFLPQEGARLNGRVYAFTLDGNAESPKIPLERRPIPEPPKIPASTEEVERGALVYERFCVTCHGIAAISGGVLPDLRRSAWLQDPVVWQQAVVKGSLSDRGMPRFGDYVTEVEAEWVRAYVAREAASQYVEEQARQSGP